MKNTRMIDTSLNNRDFVLSFLKPDGLHAAALDKTVKRIIYIDFCNGLQLEHGGSIIGMTDAEHKEHGFDINHVVKSSDDNLLLAANYIRNLLGLPLVG